MFSQQKSSRAKSAPTKRTSHSTSASKRKVKSDTELLYINSKNPTSAQLKDILLHNIKALDQQLKK